jgi:hypothetical protein
LSSSAIRAAKYDLDLDELERGLGKRPVSWQRAAVALTPYWPIWPMTKISRHSHLRVAPVCLSRRRARRRWITLKTVRGLTLNTAQRQANILTCRWKNMSHF